jgi:hypothetical protein
VQGRDVLKRHEDVTVQLDVGDFLDVAVGGEHAFLVLAPEKRHFNLLAQVLVGVVLDGSKASRFGSTKRVVPAGQVAKCGYRPADVSSARSKAATFPWLVISMKAAGRG